MSNNNIIKVDFKSHKNNDIVKGYNTIVISLSTIRRRKAVREKVNLKNQYLAFMVAKERKVILDSVSFEDYMYMKESSIAEISKKHQHDIDKTSEAFENILKSVNRINALLNSSD